MPTSTTLGYDDLPDLLTRLDGDEKHDWAALSTLDVLWVLYDRVLRVAPETAGDPDRDRFLLSKGHGPAAYYAVLAAKGFIPLETLETFGGFASPLGNHPDHTLIDGVEISSGSLGHGLPTAVGRALALHGDQRVVCLVGDAELEEGSNWEAVQLAGRLDCLSAQLRAVERHQDLDASVRRPLAQPVRRHREHRHRCVAQHRVRDAAVDEASEAAASVG